MSSGAESYDKRFAALVRRVERLTVKLAADGDSETDAADAQAHAIRRAIDRLYELGRFCAVPSERYDEISRLTRAKVEAMGESARLRRARREREIAEIDAKIREERRNRPR
jgi:hypothetical protein